MSAPNWKFERKLVEQGAYIVPGTQRIHELLLDLNDRVDAQRKVLDDHMQALQRLADGVNRMSIILEKVSKRT